MLTFGLASTTWPGVIDALNGVIPGPAHGSDEEVLVLVSASAGALEASRTIRIIGTERPIYTGPGDFQVTDGPIITIDFSELYIDPLGGDLIFGLDNGIEAPPAPSATVDPVTGVFTVDTDEFDFGFYDFSVTATNAAGTTSPYLTISPPQQ